MRAPDTCWGQWRLKAAQAALPAVAFLVAFLTVPASAQQLAAAAPLRIVSFDLAEPDNAFKPPEAPATRKSAWRTSFGSERETVAQVTAKPAPHVDADVALVQGVENVRALRRLFPARHWRLIVSREILSRVTLVAGSDIHMQSGQPTTAVAVRYSAHLRVTGQNHMAFSDGVGEETRSPSAAGTAVRLAIGERTLWVVSAGLSRACRERAEECAAAIELERWRNAKLDADEPTVVGGQTALAPTDEIACANQSMVADPMVPNFVQEHVRAENAGEGCVARLFVTR